jgi:hypothetical protein
VKRIEFERVVNQEVATRDFFFSNSSSRCIG